MKKGTKIDNRYVVQKLLGEGGMGAVYLVKDQDSGKELALKVVHPDSDLDPQMVRHFRQEFEAID